MIIPAEGSLRRPGKLYGKVNDMTRLIKDVHIDEREIHYSEIPTVVLKIFTKMRNSLKTWLAPMAGLVRLTINVGP